MKRVSITQKIFLFFLPLIFSMKTLAWDGYTKITEVATFSDGHVVVKFDAFTSHVCGTSGHFSLGTQNQDDKRKNMLSIALTAFTAGKRVYVTTGGCVNSAQESVNFISIVNN